MSSRIALIAALALTLGALVGWPAVIAVPGGVAASLMLSGQPARLLTVVALLAALIGWARVELHPAPAPASLDGVTVIEGAVASVPQVGPSGPRALVEVQRATLASGETRPDSGAVLVFFGDMTSEVRRGDRIRANGAFTSLAGLDPGFRRFVRSERAGGTWWASHVTTLERSPDRLNALVRLRTHLTDRITDAVPGDEGALIAGFVTGVDAGLSEEARQAFDRTNTSHITAVSGGNIAILIGMWMVMTRRDRVRRSPAAQVALVALIWVYVGLVGFPSPALRAGVFASLMILPTRLGRAPDPLTSLLTASALLLMARPTLAGSVGFWLSMAASLALVTSIGAASRDRRRNLSIPQVALGLTAAQVATLPITFWVFGQWSPGALLANLLIAPVVALVFPVAFVFGLIALVSPQIAAVIGWIPGIGAGIVLAIVEGLAQVFPLLRTSTLGQGGVVLVSLACLAVIAVISADARRWLARIAHARSGSGWVFGAVTLGIAAGTTIGVVMLPLVTAR